MSMNPKTDLCNAFKDFSKEDRLFLSITLKNKINPASTLSEYSNDTSMRRRILGDKAVFAAIQSEPNRRRISSFLYYSIIVTQALQAAGVYQQAIIDTLIMGIRQLAEKIRQKNADAYRCITHIPLTIAIGIKDQDADKQFQIISDLQKACLIIEGTIPRKPIISAYKSSN